MALSSPEALGQPACIDLLLQLLRAAADAIAALGFARDGDVEQQLETLRNAQGEAYAGLLLAHARFDTGSAERLKLTARLLTTHQGPRLGSGFIHLELYRDGATTQHLPPKEQLHLQCQCARFAEPALPDNMGGHYVTQLMAALDRFDAQSFARLAGDALQP